MSGTPLRIGVLGAAWIAEVNGYAILHESVSNCVVTAIASRSPEKAEVCVGSCSCGVISIDARE